MTRLFFGCCWLLLDATGGRLPLELPLPPPAVAEPFLAPSLAQNVVRTDERVKGGGVRGDKRQKECCLVCVLPVQGRYIPQSTEKKGVGVHGRGSKKPGAGWVVCT